MMRLFDSRQTLPLLAFLGLALGAWRLSTRFYTSAAFESPILFSITTLLFCAVACGFRPQWTRSNLEQAAQPVEALRLFKWRSINGNSTQRSSVRELVAAMLCKWPYFVLLVCLVARTLMFWQTLRNGQCGRPGFGALLPFVVLTRPYWSSQPTEELPATKPDQAELPRAKASILSRLLWVAYFVVAFMWGPVSGWALETSYIKTAAVCPVGWRLVTWTPFLQVMMAFLDTELLVCLSQVRWREVNDAEGASHFLRILFFTAASCIAVIAFLPILFEFGDLIWMLRLQYVDVRDLLLDSFVGAVMIMSGISLLGYLHPSTVAVIGVSLGTFGWQIPSFGSIPHYQLLYIKHLMYRMPRLVILGGVVILSTTIAHSASQSTTTATLHKWIRLVYMAVVGLCLASAVLFPAPPAGMTIPAAVEKLTKVAEFDFTQWAEKARSSGTLNEAVAEYEHRYGIPPPPNFDKWYEFAKSHNSAIIDSFDQIHNDLLPFWAIEPAEIRSRTEQLLGDAVLGMGGLRIRSGKVEESPHIPGTHRWSTEALERMIQPFAQWLPDMDFAVNLGDECRVTVPYEEMEMLLQQAPQAQERLASAKSSKSLVSSSTVKTEWPKDWVELRGDFDEKAHDVPDFKNNLRKQLYYEWIAPTCPANSPARNTRWWDRTATCADCLTPHSILTDEGAVMADVSKANDLCYQPDLAHLSGFIASPAVMSTKKLFPVFSQSRVGGFSDILFPSPWNFNLKTEYEENEDVNWADKRNALFWRGTSSDGYSWDGLWTGFLRARFVKDSHRYGEYYSEFFKDEDDFIFGVNASFRGSVDKCHSADCRAKLATFRHWGQAVLPPGQDIPEADDPLPFSTPFNEHWRYKHLMDMDGAGFSGRFLPFLQSRSLVYRAALFRTWFDERLRAWHHYVPADIRLGHGFWSVLRYLASDGKSTDNEDFTWPDAQRKGDDIAQLIAQRGRDWAAKALREEDMQIYMFRLLLEWGRVVDDGRESLGYSAGN